MATRVLVNGTPFDVEVLEHKRDAVTFRLADRTYRVEFAASVDAYSEPSSGTGRSPSPNQTADGNANQTSFAPTSGTGAVVAPIPGVVVEILVKPGQQVQAGEVLLRVEAMKMQNNIFAPQAGTVSAVSVSVGQEVKDGELLLQIQS